MIAKRKNVEISTNDPVEIAVAKAAGFEITDASGELIEKTLSDVSDRELKELAARFAVPQHGMLSKPAELRALIAKHMD